MEQLLVSLHIGISGHVIMLHFCFLVGEDFRDVDDFVIFAPMEQVKEYDVEIFDEEKVEGIQEMFFVVLEFLPDRERVPGLTLGQSTATVFIIDYQQYVYNV